MWDSLSAFADGCLGPPEAELVKRHLALCECCARDLAFMNLTASAISGFDQIAPPPALRESILAATVNRIPIRARIASALLGSGRAWQVGLAGAACAALYCTLFGHPERPVRTVALIQQAPDREQISRIESAPTVSHPKSRLQ